MNILMASGIIVFVAWAYILFLRPMVLAHFPVIVTVESKLWASSRQVLMARIFSFGGLFVGLHDFIMQSGVDSSTFLNELAKVVPDQYRGLVLASVLFFGGIALEWLRKVTKGPVGSSSPDAQ